jgi:hypothetical protein
MARVTCRRSEAYMTTTRKKRPRDPVQLGKLIVDIATGQTEDREDDGKNAAAAELGRKGGTARAAKLSPEERSEIARKGATTRWAKAVAQDTEEAS